MFGDILVRPGLGREPKPNERFYCEDWQCPAWMECEHHYGRSHAYTAMIPFWEPLEGPASKRNRTPFYTPDRPPYAAQCRFFRRDIPREWLKGWCEPPLQHGEQRAWCCVGCGAPECPRSSNVVQLFPAIGAA